MIKIAYICDICGAVKDSKNKISTVQISKINNSSDIDAIDLCADCRSNLMIWLKGQKKPATAE